MRPIELTVRGFRSFRDEVTFDFRGRRLVGVVGPIGSGKSSLLDAIAFALYGKTPTFERDTKSLINQLSDECHVRLRFQVGGETWSSVRSLRAGKGASGHQLERLDGPGRDAERLEIVTGERAVRDRVERLLGLDFDAFTRSVLLAQNRFADFLQAGDAERNAVLKGVFGYDRFDRAREIAKRRAGEASVRLEELAREGERIVGARERLADVRTRLGAAVAAVARVESAREAAEVQLDARRRAAEQLGSATAELALLERTTSSLPAEGQLADSIEEARRATADLERATDEHDAAAAADERAAAECAAVAERTGDRGAFAKLVTEFDHLGEAADAAEAAVARAEEAAAAAAIAADEAATRKREAAAEVVAAQSVLEDDDRMLKMADERLHSARHEDMALTLASGLDPGDPCPVCDRPIETLPDRPPAPDVAEADAASTDARARQQASRVTLEKAATAAATATERASAAIELASAAREAVDSAKAALVDAEARLAAARSELVDRLGEGDPHELVATHEAETIEAERVRNVAAARLEAARASRDEARTFDERTRKALASSAARLSSVWGLLGEALEVQASPEALISASNELRGTISTRRDSAGASRAEAAELTDQSTDALAAILGEIGAEPDVDLTRLIADAAAERASTERELAEIESVLAEGADVEQRHERAARRRDVATRLAQDLQPSRFLVFLLTEERAALAELGSVHLEQLTGGAYRFTDDAGFDVVDLNAAGTTRRAESLSGGETFLASLGLALALAEMVSRGGGRLDAFFLDEGFGSLDPEHLDRAMDGIERLVQTDEDRLVVLVSHVAEMREALEDLIVLDKDERTGDTIVRSGASPA